MLFLIHLCIVLAIKLVDDVVPFSVGIGSFGLGRILQSGVVVCRMLILCCAGIVIFEVVH